MLALHGLLLKTPEQLPPSGGFTTGTWLLTILEEEAGEVFRLTATDEAAEAMAKADTPCRAVFTVRPRSVSLSQLTNGSTKGTAFKLRVLTAHLASERKAA